MIINVNLINLFFCFVKFSLTLLLCGIQSSYAQQSKIDSLFFILKTAKEDTHRVNALNILGLELMYQNPDTSILFGKQALSILTFITNKNQTKQSHEYNTIIKKILANTYSNLGVYYWLKDDYPQAISYHVKAFQIRKNINDKKGISSSLGNIGNVYSEQGDYPKSLKYFFKALEIDKELGNKIKIAASLSNIGIIYKEQGNFPQALKYYHDALEIDKELGNKMGMSKRLGNTGVIYRLQGNFTKALKYYFEALEIDKELKNKNGIASRLNNIGTVYAEQGDSANTIGNKTLQDDMYFHALINYFEALKINKEIGKKSHIVTNLCCIGILYTKQKKYKEAKNYLNESLALSLEIGSLHNLMTVNQNLSDLYVQTHHYPLAYKHYKQYSTVKASLFNEEKSKEIGRLEQKHETELEKLKNEKIKNEELIRESEKIKRRNLLQYSGILLTLFFMFMSIFLLARKFRKIKKYKIYEKYFKIVEAALFISFLIFFEFILVLLEPYLEKITGGEPAYKLLVNAILAGVIFPLHSFLETKLKASVMKTEVGSPKSEVGGSKTLLLLVGFIFISLFNVSFSNKVDSLKVELSKPQHDTTRINLLNNLSREYFFINPDTSNILSSHALKTAMSIGFNKGIGVSLTNIGNFYYVQGGYINALKSYLSALIKYREINNNLGIAVSLGNIGNVYRDQGDYPNALKHYYEALEMDKKLGNKNGIARDLGNIGVVYKNQGDYPNALKYYNEALEINKDLGNKRGMAIRLGNIGNVYDCMGHYTNALKFHQKALDIDKDLGNKNGIARHLGNIGNVYDEQKDYPNALKYYFEAMEINKELGLKEGISADLGNIGSLYIKTGRFLEAEVYLNNALAISDSIGTLNYLMQVEKIFSHLYDTTCRWQLAFTHYKKYCTAKDSLFNEEKSKEIGRLEQKHEFEMEELEREQKEAEQARIAAELKERKNNLQHSAILIGILFLFGMFFFIVKIPLPEWTVELSTFAPFMILFEFTLVLMDPYIDNITGGEPLYKLLINALWAAVIFPIHSFFEKKLKNRISEIKRKKDEQFAEEFRKEVEEIEHSK